MTGVPGESRDAATGGTAGGSSLSGRLVVAAPMLTDPNFDRTVVLMLEHGEEGGLGLVLNRPSTIEVRGPLPDWESMATPPQVVFVGGPVSQGAVIALARVGTERRTEAWSRVLPRIGVLDLNSDPAEAGVDVEEVRIFTGYAGWGAGQLEGEIREGAWFVVDALPADALATDPDQLWAEVLRRQGGALGRLALYPPDPSVN